MASHLSAVGWIDASWKWAFSTNLAQNRTTKAQFSHVIFASSLPPSSPSSLPPLNSPINVSSPVNPPTVELRTKLRPTGKTGNHVVNSNLGHINLIRTSLTFLFIFAPRDMESSMLKILLVAALFASSHGFCGGYISRRPFKRIDWDQARHLWYVKLCSFLGGRQIYSPGVGTLCDYRRRFANNFLIGFWRHRCCLPSHCEISTGWKENKLEPDFSDAASHVPRKAAKCILNSTSWRVKLTPFARMASRDFAMLFCGPKGVVGKFWPTGSCQWLTETRAIVQSFFLLTQVGYERRGRSATIYFPSLNVARKTSCDPRLSQEVHEHSLDVRFDRKISTEISGFPVNHARRPGCGCGRMTARTWLNPRFWPLSGTTSMLVADTSFAMDPKTFLKTFRNISSVRAARKNVAGFFSVWSSIRGGSARKGYERPTS